MEYRIKDVELQCEEGVLKVGGYINVTERESEMLYSKKRGKWFKEVMKRGVFETAIKRASEIPLLLEHNWDKQLASTRNNSLTLKEDQIGLRFDAVIDDEKVYEEVKSGTINSCSFGFRALQEEIQPINNRLEKRFVTGIELLEVSLVKNPAYVGSLVESRAYEEELENEAVIENPEVTEEATEEKAEETKDTEEVTTEETQEETTEESTEEVAEEAEESTEENKEEEENEARDFISEEVTAEEVTAEEVTVDVTEEVAELVEDLIEQKEAQLESAENNEQLIKEHIEDVKNYHKEVEAELEYSSNLLNLEIVKLRLDLIKLKNIKEHI